jgi:RNA polymerase sigma-70 factor (ECF subfamily)
MRIGPAFDSVLAAAQAGAPWAFERLWRAFAPPVAGYLRLQGAADPDDLTSEVFLGAFRRLAAFAGNEAQFQAWLFTIAHRRLVDALRRASCRPLAAEWGATDVAGGDVEDDALARLGEERVRGLCDLLPAGQRDVLLLRLVGDLTVDQVAGVLGRTPGAVKALQRRGFATLRGILEREGVPL